MKFFAIVTFALIATSAAAQESYTVNVPAGKVAQISVILQYHNLLEVCAPLSIAAGACTQANVCAATNPAISPCTPANARAAKARIYPLTFAGRDEWFSAALVQEGLPDLQAKAIAARKALYDAWVASANDTDKNADCTKIGAPAGCQ